MKLRVAFVLPLALGWVDPASAQVSPEAQARTVNLFSPVGGYCPAVARVDVPLT